MSYPKFNTMDNSKTQGSNLEWETVRRKKNPSALAGGGGEGENAKISVRNIRRDAIEQIKKLQKDGTSEDACKDAEKEVQDTTDKFIALVDKHLAAKEKEIMAV
jgi:ribosome recycling factor